jgi:phosphatidylglycerol---prolipoprotein diacylglyceryl transferase
MKRLNEKEIATSKLGWTITVLGILLSIILFYPFSQFFSLQWSLNQQVDLFDVGIINFFGTELPIGIITIRFYALFIFVGVLAGYFLSLHLSKHHYIASTVIDRLLIGLVIFGLIGARIFYVLFNWSEFTNEPINILYINRGGLAFFGMLVAGLLYLIFYTRWFKFNLWEFLDFLAPSVLIGQVIGRFGNFFNYEAYGPATKVFWAMRIPESANLYTDLNQHYFHPTFLYEIIPNFILLCYLLINYEKLIKRRAGIVFAIWAMGYGAIRIFTEFFRLDALKVELPRIISLFNDSVQIQYLYVSSLTALILLISGIVIYTKRKKIVYLKKDMTEIGVG